MKLLLSVTFLLAFLFVEISYAQENLQITPKDSIVKSSWIVGLGFNAVDDSGDVFDELFDVSNQWNLLPYPSRLSIGRYFKSGLGIEAIGSYNTYKEGKLIDGIINAEESTYLGLDTRLTYDLNKVIGETGWFDPYIGVGAGYTDANNVSRGTYNAVIGFRTWFSDKWGIDFNSSGKWTMTRGNGETNHLQHAVGVVHQFGIEKALSKRGLKKQELIAALEKESQRKMDSISEVNRLRDESILANRLAKEKAAADLAAVEKAKMDAENNRRNQIENSIRDLGYVYFGLNSSFLNQNSKNVLDGLILILNESPSVQIKITSHTDSRGTSNYNNWLSQRRVKHTKSYLINSGIPESRLSTEAYGEDKLLNECDNNTYCPEEKHGVNRRSEFVIERF